jgi:hypothetical protein
LGGAHQHWHRTLKEQAIRPGTPLDLEQARAIVAEFVAHCNNARLHSAIGYVTPKDKLEGRAVDVCRARDQKLEAAREMRRQKRAGWLEMPISRGNPFPPVLPVHQRCG